MTPPPHPQKGNPALRRVMYTLLALLLLCLYLFLVPHLGWGIPCPFYQLTSYQCPACGVTRMGICLLDGDWRAAWEMNAGLLLLSPLIFTIILHEWLRWVRGAPRHDGKLIEWLSIVTALLLLLWALYRNTLAS